MWQPYAAPFSVLHNSVLMLYNPQDHPARVRFLLLQKNNDGNYMKRVLLANEATLARNEVDIFRNTYVWKVEKSHVIQRTNFSNEFSINPQAAIVSGTFSQSSILLD